LTIAAVMATGILGGWVLYRVIETPFMQLRARWYPAGTLTTSHASAAMTAGHSIRG